MKVQQYNIVFPVSNPPPFSSLMSGLGLIQIIPYRSFAKLCMIMIFSLQKVDKRESEMFPFRESP